MLEAGAIPGWGALILGLVSAYFVWSNNRDKTKADREANNVHNRDGAIKGYDLLTEDLWKSLNDARAELQKSREELNKAYEVQRDLLVQNQLLTTQNHEVMAENRRLMSQNQEVIAQNHELMAQLESITTRLEGGEHI